LLVVILGLIASIVYLSVSPQPGDKFTEFYVLNKDGKASDYPREIATGQPAEVIMGIINHEGKSASYTIRITADSAIINSIETGSVSNGQKWERKTDFTLARAGDNQRVEFSIYLNNESTPHIKDPLAILLNVSNSK